MIGMVVQEPSAAAALAVARIKQAEDAWRPRRVDDHRRSGWRRPHGHLRRRGRADRQRPHGHRHRAQYAAPPHHHGAAGYRRRAARAGPLPTRHRPQPPDHHGKHLRVQLQQAPDPPRRVPRHRLRPADRPAKSTWTASSIRPTHAHPTALDVPLMASALRSASYEFCGARGIPALSWVCPAAYLRDSAPARDAARRRARRPRDAAAHRARPRLPQRRPRRRP